MKTQKLIAYLSANAIPFNKAFIRAENEGCISEYSQIFSDAYVQIEKYLRYGLNNGFTPALKEMIGEVIKIVVTICGERTIKNKTKINKQLIDIDAMMRDQMEARDNAEGEGNIANAVLQSVESYERSLGTLLGKEETPRKNVLKTSRQKLATLREIISSDVADVCSTEALAFAEKILSNLRLWGERVATNMHDESVNTLLDNALAEASAWASKEKGVVVNKSLFGTRSNLAKDISSVKFKKDAMSEISEGAVSLNKVTMFRENLAGFKKSILEGRYSTQEDEESLSKQRAKRAELVKDLEQCDIDFDNGIIDEDTYNMNCDDLEYEIKECDKEIVFLRKQIQTMVARSRAYKQVIRKVELLNRVIFGFQDDPQTLNYVVGNIDFTKVNNVLRGFGSEEEIMHVTEIAFVTNELDAIAQSKLNDILTSFERQEQKEEVDPIEQEKEKAEREAARRARRMARMGGEPQPQPAEPVKAEPEKVRSSPVQSFAGIIDDN